MKRKVVLVLVAVILAIPMAAQFEVKGVILDEDQSPLQGSTIYILELEEGSVSNAKGQFSMEGIPGGTYTLKVSYVGYQSHIQDITVDGDLELEEIVMNVSSFMGEEVVVTALGAGKKTPMAYVNLNREEIKYQNVGQDVPYILASTPSVITSSDAGHGIGYTSMRIRGTDANRINVTINGIPLNDAESHSVFWVDLPELASSASQIQIQRGVGTSTNGSAAFGASVNLETQHLKTEPYVEYDFTAGSFNTLRNSLQAGTGLIKDMFSVNLRLSDLHSDGFIDRAWTDLQSYYLNAGWYGKRSELKFITFGGFEELYQSWGGVPSYLLETDRTFNGMGAYTDSSGQTAFYENQVDHYDQVHYQLHFSNQWSEKLQLNAALHYTIGKGYYEQYEVQQDYTYYGMKLPVIGNDTIFQSDLVRRKWLDNDFYGAIASAIYTTGSANLILGGGWNRYDGLHYGKVIWAQFMGENSKGHQWYEGDGVKTDWNIYTKYYQDISSSLTAFFDLQLRGINHLMEGSDANNRVIDQEHDFLFFNPKAGLNFIPAPGQRAFFSYARASREPNRNNFTDAPPGREPVYETLNDFEAGYSYSAEKLRTGFTLYFMDYTNQLVLTGEINEVGYPVMTNVKDSYRAGIEMEASYNYFNKIRWEGNLTLSRNVIRGFTNYIDNWDYYSDPENEAFQREEFIGDSKLAFSPEIVLNSLIEYRPLESVRVGIISKYVGKQYIDNTADDSFLIEAYFVNDLRISYQILPAFAERISISLLVRNLLDTAYETNAWLYRYIEGGEQQFFDGYYPQAGRHLMLSLGLEF